MERYPFVAMMAMCILGAFGVGSAFGALGMLTAVLSRTRKAFVLACISNGGLLMAVYYYPDPQFYVTGFAIILCATMIVVRDIRKREGKDAPPPYMEVT